MFFPMEANTQAITVGTETEHQDIPYAEYGFKNTGFGSWVRKTEIHVDIVVSSGRWSSGPDRFAVYVCHGAPGGAYWRGCEPLVRCNTMEEAKQKAPSPLRDHRE